MRKTKKLIAVIMTVAMLASMMVPALAATSQVEADALLAAGLMRGTGAGLELDATLNRIQGITFTVRAHGAEAAALAMSEEDIDAALANVQDVGAIASWARPYAAYAVANNITVGVGGAEPGKIMFAPLSPLSGLQFITMMVRTLGYTGVTLDNCLDIALKAGMLSASQAVSFGRLAQLTRGDAAVIIHHTVSHGLMALEGGVTPSALTLINRLVDAGAVTAAAAVALGYVAPTPTPAPLLTVAAISATNLRQIVVKFNQVPDEATAENIANYTLSAGLALSSAVLVGDTVTLTLTANVAQQTNITVTFRNITTLGGVAIVEGTRTVNMLDVTIPSFVSYAFTGPQTIELTYSEPLRDVGTALVNNGVFGATAAPHAARNNVVVVTLGTALPAGAHTLRMTGVSDGTYIVAPADISITYAPDTTLPTVTISRATQTSVTLTFSKDVRNLTAANFYHTFPGINVPVLVTTSADGFLREVVLDFTLRPMPAGNNHVVVLRAVGTSHIEDRWGNRMAADAHLVATVSADTTAPTVTSVEATSDTTVVVTFSEDVTSPTAIDKANYVFRNAAGTVVTPAAVAITYVAATRRATITFAALAGGNYTVTVAAVRDASLSQNMMATVTLPFVVTDRTAITTLSAISVEGNAAADRDMIYVTFPENMSISGAGSVLNAANYRLGTDATTAVALPQGTTISVFGANSRVMISMPADLEVVLENQHLFVRNLADASGNVMTALFLEVDVVRDQAPTITQVRTIALNRLELDVDKELSSVIASGIVVDTAAVGAGLAVAHASFVNSAGKATITVTLNADEVLANEGDKPTSISIGAISVRSITGLDMQPGEGILGTTSVLDRIAPAFVSYRQVSPTQIIAQYSEAIDATFLARGTFTVADRVVLSAPTTVSPTAIATNTTSAFVLITLTDNIPAGTLASVTQVFPVLDLAGNSLASVAAATAGVRPFVTNALTTTADTFTLAAGTTSTAITFSAALSPAGRAAVVNALQTAVSPSGIAITPVWNAASTSVTVYNTSTAAINFGNTDVTAIIDEAGYIRIGAVLVNVGP